MPVVSTFKKAKYSERNAQIRSLAMQGKSSKELAEMFNLKVTNIRYICKGMLRDAKRYKPSKRNLLDSLDEKSVAYFKEKFKVKTKTKRTGCPRSD